MYLLPQGIDRFLQSRNFVEKLRVESMKVAQVVLVGQ